MQPYQTRSSLINQLVRLKADAVYYQPHSSFDPNKFSNSYINGSRKHYQGYNNLLCFSCRISNYYSTECSYPNVLSKDKQIYLKNMVFHGKNNKRRKNITRHLASPSTMRNTIQPSSSGQIGIPVQQLKMVIENKKQLFSCKPTIEEKES